jgi:hypothetical protein
LTRTFTKKKRLFKYNLGSFASNQTYGGHGGLFERSLREKKFELHYHAAADVAYSLIRPKSQILKIRHDGTYSIDRKFHADDENLKLEFEPVHPKMCSLLPWYTEFPVYSRNFILGSHNTFSN